MLALAIARDQDTFLFFPPSFLSFSMLRPVVGCTIRAARAATLLPSPPEERKEEETSAAPAAAAGLCPPTLHAAAAVGKKLSGGESPKDNGAKLNAAFAVDVGQR